MSRGLIVIEEQGTILVGGTQGPPGPPGVVKEAYTFSFPSGLTPMNAPIAGRARVYLEADYAVDTVRAAMSSAVITTPLTVDVNRNGTTIYTDQAERPEIAVAGLSATGNDPAVVQFDEGDYITVDLDTGVIPAGDILTVVVRLYRV